MVVYVFEFNLNFQIIMNRTTNILKKTAGVTLFLFIGFVVYANLEPRPLHTTVEPIKLAVFDMPDIQSEEEGLILSSRISALKGVTACVVNTEAKRMSITFHEDDITEADLRKAAAEDDQKVLDADFGGVKASGPECPVPTGWISAFETAKYAVNFR